MTISTKILTRRVPKVGAKGYFNPTGAPADGMAVEVTGRDSEKVDVKPPKASKAIAVPVTELSKLDFDQADWEDVPAYPESDKLAKIKDTSQAIYDFLEAVGEKGVRLTRVVPDHVCPMEPDESEEVHIPVGERELKELLAEHFGIDLAKVDAEKEQMLQDLRAMNS